MYSYSIMKDLKGHEEKICLDIKRQYGEGIADLVLFSMTLTPEGVPPIPKAEMLTERYAVYRDRLEKDGLKLGILAQATIGHGRKSNAPTPLWEEVSFKTEGSLVTVDLPLITLEPEALILRY